MENFNDFMKRTFKNLEEAPYLRDLFSNLDYFSDDLIEKKSPRLIVNMPPRHLKSETVSIRLPSYIHSKNPNLDIGVFVANKNIANIFRNKNNEIKNLHDNKSNENNLKYFGLDSESVNGYKFDLIIIDDAIRNPMESNSLRFKYNTHTFIKKLLEQHLNPCGGFINVQSRWCKDDTTGFLLEVCYYHKWKVLKYPALNICNDPLTNRFEYNKNNLYDPYFQTLFMQEPVL